VGAARHLAVAARAHQHQLKGRARLYRPRPSLAGAAAERARRSNGPTHDFAPLMGSEFQK